VNVADLTHAAAVCCVAAGLVAGAAVALSAREGLLGLRVALDFWLAAGLLNLSRATGWEALLVTALIIAVRQTVGMSLRHTSVQLRDLLPWGSHIGPASDTAERR
jgi:uncharacterized membrane protein